MSVIIGQESPATRPSLAEGSLAPPAMATGSILSERCVSQSPRFTPPPTFAKGCSKPGSLCVILNSHLLGAFPRGLRLSKPPGQAQRLPLHLTASGLRMERGLSAHLPSPGKRPAGTAKFNPDCQRQGQAS